MPSPKTVALNLRIALDKKIALAVLAKRQGTDTTKLVLPLIDRLLHDWSENPLKTGEGQASLNTRPDAITRRDGAEPLPKDDRADVRVSTSLVGSKQANEGQAINRPAATASLPATRRGDIPPVPVEAGYFANSPDTVQTEGNHPDQTKANTLSAFAEPANEAAFGTEDNQIGFRALAGDAQVMKAYAAKRGMTASTFMKLLLRSWVSGKAVLPEAELNVLSNTLNELSAVGRTLNQISRHLTSPSADRESHNKEAGATAVHDNLATALTETQNLVLRLKDDIRMVIQANIDSWEKDYGE